MPFFLLSFASLLFCTNSVKNMLPQLVSWPFHDLISGVKHSETLLQVEPNIELDSSQAAGPIELSLVLKNQNKNAVTIPNPVDFLNYMLLDAQGTPLPNSAVPSRIKLSVEDWDSWEHPYFPLIQVLKNGNALPLAETLRLKTIVLDAGATYTFSFQIKGTPPVSAENGQNEIAPLPAGKYALILTYSMFLSTETQPQNRLLQTDQIPLHLQ